MKFNIFGKEDKNKKKKAPVKANVSPAKKEETKVEADKSIETTPKSAEIIGVGSVLRGFYISEKSSLIGAMSQYIFRVSKNSNKSEIKKEVGRIYKVKVKDVKILNMPKKRRDIGKHPGFKSGFKKAIVVLEKGQVIEQAKA